MPDPQPEQPEQLIITTAISVPPAVEQPAAAAPPQPPPPAAAAKPQEAAILPAATAPPALTTTTTTARRQAAAAVSKRKASSKASASSSANNKRSQSTAIYDGSILALDAMPLEVANKLRLVLDDLRQLAQDNQPDLSVDGFLRDWSLRASKRNNVSAVDFLYYNSDSKCRSKVELAKKMDVLRPDSSEDEDEDDDDDFEAEVVPAPRSSSGGRAPPKLAAAAAPAASSASSSSGGNPFAHLLLPDGSEELAQPLRVSRYTVVHKLGRIPKDEKYPVGYLARTLFPSPISPIKDVVYECRIDPGPVFVVRHVGHPTAADIPPADALPSAPVVRSGPKAKKKPTAAGGGGGDDGGDDADDASSSSSSRIQPHGTTSDERLVFQFQGKTAFQVWSRVVHELETIVGTAIARFGYMSAAQPLSHEEETCRVLVQDLVNRVCEVKKPTILTSEELRTNLGDYLFGFCDFRVQSLLKMQECDEDDTRRRRVQTEMSLKRLSEDLERKLSKSVMNFAERFRSTESKAERACDRKMRQEFNLSKLHQERVKKQVTKLASVNRKQDHLAGDQSKRVLALATLDRLGALAKAKVPAGLRALDDLLAAVDQCRAFWNPKYDVGLVPPQPASAFAFATAEQWKERSLDLVEAWDFAQNFAVVLGLCTAESRAVHIPGEFVIGDKMFLKTRAPDFLPSLAFDDFCQAFDECDDQLMAPLHTGLLRLAVSAVFAYREDIRLRMETAKKNGHPITDLDDELDRFGRVVGVERDVKDGDFLHFLVQGVPVCEAAWFHLAKVCFGLRHQPQQQEEAKYKPSKVMEVEEENAPALSAFRQVLALQPAPASLANGEEEDGDGDGDGEYLPQLDEDDERNRFKSEVTPTWVRLLSQLRDMPSNRARRMQDLIEQAMAKVPKPDPKGYKRILREALALYESNTGTKMRERALEAITLYASSKAPSVLQLQQQQQQQQEEQHQTGGEDDSDEGEDDKTVQYPVAIRPLTPFDSHCLRIALQACLRKCVATSGGLSKATSRAHFEPRLRAVESKTYSCSQNMLADLTQVFVSGATSKQRRGQAGKLAMEELMRDGAKLEEEFNSALDQACKEAGAMDLGGVGDLCVVRRMGMTRPHTLFSYYSKKEEDGGVASPPPQWEQDLAAKPQVAAATAATEEEEEDDNAMRVQGGGWQDELYAANEYRELSRKTRLAMLRTLVDIALDSDEIRLDLRIREAEVEKARSKFGNANHLYSIAPNKDKFNMVAECEVALDQVLSNHQGTLEPAGVRVEQIEQCKRDVHEEMIARKRLFVTAQFRTELDRLMAVYDSRSKLVGHDRVGRPYYYFCALKQIMCMEHERGVAKLVDASAAWYAELHASAWSCEKDLATNCQEQFLPSVAIWCRGGAAGGAQASHAAAPEPPAAAEEAAAAAVSPAPQQQQEDEWREFGPYCGLRVGRKIRFENAAGKTYVVGGFIAMYSPGNPALWKMIHDDGDLEDLEEDEVLECLQLAQCPVPSQCRGFYFPYFPDAVAVSKCSMRQAKALARRCHDAPDFASRVLLDLKVMLLCVNRLVRPLQQEEEEAKWREMVFAARTWQGLALCFAPFATGGAAQPAATNVSQLACQILKLDRTLKQQLQQQAAAVPRSPEPATVAVKAQNNTKKRPPPRSRAAPEPVEEEDDDDDEEEEEEEEESYTSRKRRPTRGAAASKKKKAKAASPPPKKKAKPAALQAKKKTAAAAAAAPPVKKKKKTTELPPPAKKKSRRLVVSDDEEEEAPAAAAEEVDDQDDDDDDDDDDDEEEEEESEESDEEEEEPKQQPAARKRTRSSAASQASTASNGGGGRRVSTRSSAKAAAAAGVSERDDDDDEEEEEEEHNTRSRKRKSR